MSGITEMWWWPEDGKDAFLLAMIVIMIVLTIVLFILMIMYPENCDNWVPIMVGKVIIPECVE